MDVKATKNECESIALTGQTELSVEEAFQLLNSGDIITTAIPPVRPKADQVYLFKPGKEANTGKSLYKYIIW